MLRVGMAFYCRIHLGAGLGGDLGGNCYASQLLFTNTLFINVIPPRSHAPRENGVFTARINITTQSVGTSHAVS